MLELVSIFNDWPIIVQGAMGSGLFWLVLLIGQSLVTALSKKYSLHSVKSRKSWLISARAKYIAATTKNNQDRNFYVTLINYRASRHFYKAFMWLVLGLITNTLVYPFGIIGYVGSLYYLFKAYDVVSPVHVHEDAEEELKKINKELKDITNT